MWRGGRQIAHDKMYSTKECSKEEGYTPTQKIDLLQIVNTEKKNSKDIMRGQLQEAKSSRNNPVSKLNELKCG